MAKASRAARALSEVLATLGVLLVLYCVYQLFYTSVVANRVMAQENTQLERTWAADRGTAVPVPANLPVGARFAIIHIPRLDKVLPVLQGTNLSVLAKGIGHYTETAMPGQLGNFAVAGHRKTHGDPFLDFPELRVGDPIVIQTATGWYTYVLDVAPYIAGPRDTTALDPVPNHPFVEPTKRLITLTTCNPWWGHTQRLIVRGHLTDQRSSAAGAPPILSAPSGPDNRAK